MERVVPKNVHMKYYFPWTQAQSNVLYLQYETGAKERRKKTEEF